MNLSHGLSVHRHLHNRSNSSISPITFTSESQLPSATINSIAINQTGSHKSDEWMHGLDQASDQKVDVACFFEEDLDDRFSLTADFLF
jgi:hypothetical protein